MASEQTVSGGDRPVILLVEDEALTIMDLGDVLEDGGGEEDDGAVESAPRIFPLLARNRANLRLWLTSC